MLLKTVGLEPTPLGYGPLERNDLLERLFIIFQLTLNNTHLIYLHINGMK